MPFISKERRVLIELNGLESLGADIQPGDICYFYYKQMVDRWKLNPRWTEADKIYREIITKPVENTYPGDHIAWDLAWQVFFHIHVMPYELKKQEENGDI